MKKERGFTLIELLVVIAIIALLLAILMPSLKKAKQKGQAVVCASNLKQWNLLVSFFLDDHDGQFPDADYNDDNKGDGHGQWWIQPLKDYNENPKILLCGRAKVHPKRDPARATDDARRAQKADECWGSLDKAPAPTAGEWTWASYAPNAWMMDPKDGTWSGSPDPADYWGKIGNVKSPYLVPLFLDSRWVDVWPRDDDRPDDQEYGGTGGQGSMRQLCLTRHGKSTSVVFMDGSARHVTIKGLWGLKWYKNFDTNNPRTKDNFVWEDWIN